MKIYQFIEVECEGVRMGRTLRQKFFFRKSEAEEYLDEVVTEHNREQTRHGLGEDAKHRLFRPEHVGNVCGWISRGFGRFLRIEAVEVS